MKRRTTAEEFSTLVDIGTGCPCLSLRAASRVISRYFDTQLRPFGLTINQFGILAAIAVREPITVTDLAAALGTERTTLTRNLEPLVQQGLVVSQSAINRRYRELEISRRGLKQLRAAIPTWELARRQVIDFMDVDAAENLIRDCRRLALGNQF